MPNYNLMKNFNENATKNIQKKQKQKQKYKWTFFEKQKIQRNGSESKTS